MCESNAMHARRKGSEQSVAPCCFRAVCHDRDLYSPGWWCVITQQGRNTTSVCVRCLMCTTLQLRSEFGLTPMRVDHVPVAGLTTMVSPLLMKDGTCARNPHVSPTGVCGGHNAATHQIARPVSRLRVSQRYTAADRPEPLGRSGTRHKRRTARCAPMPGCLPVCLPVKALQSNAIRTTRHTTIGLD